MCRARVPDLYRIDAAGSSEPQLVYRTPNQKVLFDVTPDGRRGLSFERSEGRYVLRVLDFESGEGVDWLRGASKRSEAYGRFSPDGWSSASTPTSDRSR